MLGQADAQLILSVDHFIYHRNFTHQLKGIQLAHPPITEKDLFLVPINPTE